MAKSNEATSKKSALIIEYQTQDTVLNLSQGNGRVSHPQGRDQPGFKLFMQIQVNEATCQKISNIHCKMNPGHLSSSIWAEGVAGGGRGADTPPNNYTSNNKISLSQIFFFTAIDCVSRPDSDFLVWVCFIFFFNLFIQKHYF